MEINGKFPSLVEMEALIKGRRSTRKYKDENVDKKIIERLANIAIHAPTGHNNMQVLFSLIDDKVQMKKFRLMILDYLFELSKQGKLDDSKYNFYRKIAKVWKDKGKDIIFREAPHMLIASAPKEGISQEADCIIALASFELLAAVMGVGTLWCGMAKRLINELIPNFRVALGIPDNHVISYVMLFGIPDVKYYRTVQREPVNVRRITNNC